MVARDAANGGPAFPVSRDNASNPVTDMQGTDLTSGMTLRDWFAGQALMGILSNSSPTWEAGYDERTVALAAYTMADAMLAHREDTE